MYFCSPSMRFGTAEDVPRSTSAEAVVDSGGPGLASLPSDPSLCCSDFNSIPRQAPAVFTVSGFSCSRPGHRQSPVLLASWVDGGCAAFDRLRSLGGDQSSSGSSGVGEVRTYASASDGPGAARGRSCFGSIGIARTASGAEHASGRMPCA